MRSFLPRLLVFFSIIIFITPGVASITFDLSTEHDMEIIENLHISYQDLIENKQFIEELSYRFDYKLTQNDRLDRTWDGVNFEGCYFNPVPWTPMVPFKNIILETEHDIVDVKISASDQVLFNDLNLEPAPEPQWLIQPELKEYLEIENDIDNDIEYKIKNYLAIKQYYPEPDYTLTKLDTISVDGKNKFVYSLQIYPFKYNPALHIGRGYTNLDISILYSDTSSNIETYQDELSSNDGFETTETESDEYEHEHEHEPTGNEYLLPDNVKYIIITTEKLIDELTPLVAWKQRKGITTEIVDVANIYKNQSFDGYDEPEEIRNFIQYAHKELETEYILLAGDWDTIPPRMCYDPNPYYGADDGEIPADSYYSCISEGTTWDVDEDHIYGELDDLDDIYPDIIVSRISINSELKMKDWVHEVIKYECEPPATNWTDKVILLGPNVHNTGDGAKQSEYFYNNYLRFIYGTFDKFYEDSENGNQPFSRSEIVKSINQGTAFVNYLGHGGPSTWTYNYGYSKLLDKGDVNRFTNRGMKPVVYAMSCLTGWFDDPSGSGYGNFGDCIGETFTEDVLDGGIGYIGSARTSVGSINQKYGPFATGLQEDFIRQLSQQNFGLGDAFTKGKKHYSEVWGKHFPDTNSYGEVQACWLEVNLLGEPELTLWTKKPQVFNITNISQDESLVIIVKNETGYPVKNAQVCLQLTTHKGNVQHMDLKTTTSNGEAVFYVAELPPKLNLTITKPNFIPYMERITIADLVPPITSYFVTPEEPDGENDWYISEPKINLSINEDGDSYYFWDDSPESMYIEPIIPPEGNHILNFYSVDTAKNVEALQTIRFKLDLTPPKTTLQLDPDRPNGRDGWYTVQPTINLTTEPGGISFYSMDSGLNISFQKPFIAPVGVHEFYYYSKDEAGNIGIPKHITVKVDIVPPETKLVIDPVKPTGLNGWYQDSPNIQLVTEAGAETYYYWTDNDAEFVENTDFEVDSQEIIEYANQYIQPIECPEGKNILHYFSIDTSGCIEGINTHSVKLDSIAPETTCTLSPSEPTGEYGYYTSEVEITLNSSESGQIFYYWEDNYPLSYTAPFKALEGVNTLTYYSIDDAGNNGLELQVKLKIDTISPMTNLIMTPMEPTGENGWYDVIPEIEFSTEPGAVVYYSFEGFEDSIAPSRLEVPEGETKINFYSIDEAGNIGEKAFEIVKVDISPPIAKLETDKTSPSVDQVINFIADGSKDNNEIEEYYFDFGDGTTSDWITMPYVKHIYTKPGEYEVKLTVRDSSGLENEKEEIYQVFIMREPEEDDLFSFENIALITTIIASIFIVLSGLFMYTYKRYSSSSINKNITSRTSYPGIGRTGSPGSYSEYYDYEDEFEYDTELDFDNVAEAIVIDRPIVFKMKRLRCPGCKTIFVSEDGASNVKCPHCGLKGEFPKQKNGAEMTSISRKGSQIDMDNMLKFKCPACNKLFKTTGKDQIVKCPHCGVEGKV